MARAWRALWTTLPLGLAASLVVGAFILAVFVLDLIRVSGTGLRPTDVASIAVTVAIALFLVRGSFAIAALVVGLVVSLSVGVADLWLLGMAIAAGLVTAVASVPLSVGYLGAFFAGSAVAEALRDTPRPASAAVIGLIIAAVSALIGAGFRSFRQRHERLARVLADRERKHERALDDERARIADELHDYIAHDLTLALLQARVLDHSDDPDERRSAQRAIVESTSRALDDVRMLLHVTHLARSTGAPEASDPSRTLADALTDTARRVRDLGIIVDVDADPQFRDGLSPAIDTGLAHIVRESVTNAVKHTPGLTRIDIGLERSAGVARLAVRNDRPARAAAARAVSAPSGGYGLARMRERVELLGGTFTAEPDGDGWVVRVEIPAR